MSQAALPALIPPPGDLRLQKDASQSLGNLDFTLLYIRTLKQQLVCHLPLQHLLVNFSHPWKKVITVSSFKYLNEILQDAGHIEYLLGIVAHSVVLDGHLGKEEIGLA